MIKKNIMLSFIYCFLISTASADNSYFDKKKRMVICKEPLPEFTLAEKSNPSDLEVKKLCTCIWQQFPSNGWEQQTSIKIRQGEDPGWRGRALISRFGSALEKCDGYNL